MKKGKCINTEGGVWLIGTVKRGGKRPNAGRKKGLPTTTLSFRVKADKAIEIKEKIKELIASIK